VPFSKKEYPVWKIEDKRGSVLIEAVHHAAAPAIGGGGKSGHSLLPTAGDKKVAVNDRPGKPERCEQRRQGWKRLGIL
jgi:hypothetical protein